MFILMSFLPTYNLTLLDHYELTKSNLNEIKNKSYFLCFINEAWFRFYNLYSQSRYGTDTQSTTNIHDQIPSCRENGCFLSLQRPVPKGHKVRLI